MAPLWRGADDWGSSQYCELSLFSLPQWARKEIDAICRKFLWVGSDASVRRKCMVAWPTVCRPTQFGGLGVSDLKLQGYALQARALVAKDRQ